jgi:TP901 family phage tail tape measure protein
MALGGADVIGDLMVRLHADTTRYTAMMKGAEMQAEKSVGRITSIFAKGAAGMGVAVAGLGAVGVRQFAKFDDAMTKSTAIMANMNAQTRSEMEKTARGLAQNGIQSAEELAESYFFLASAGLNAEQSMAALPVVQSFATAGAFDMAKATDLLTDAQSALGLTVDDTTQNMENMTRVSDVLVKANTLSNATVEQFSESLTNKAGSQLRRFNKDVEEGVAVLSVFADQGYKGQRAGEALNIVLREMERAGRENADEWDRLNLSVFDSEGNMRNMADIIQGLEESFAGLSDEQLGARMQQLGFTAESQSFVAMLLGMSEKMRNYEASLRDVSGVTKDISENQMESFTAQMTILRNRTNDLFLSIGEGLVPILLQLTEGLRSGEGAMADYNSTAEKLSRFLQTTFLTVITTISDVWYGWKLLLKGGEMAILGFGTVAYKIFSKVEKALVGILNRGISNINAIIGALNKIPGVAIDSIGEIKFSKYTELAEDFSDALALAKTEMQGLVDAGRPSVGILDEFEKRKNAQIAEMSPNTKVPAGGMSFLSPETPSWGMSGISNEDGWQFTAPLQKAEEEQKSIYERMLDNTKEFFDGSNELAMSRMALQLDGMVNMFGQMEGETSSAYKALFAIQKAFAIASAIISVQNAIAKASESGPFPWNLGAMVAVGAATAGLITTIAGTVLSFEGGGYTGGGARAGGLDGKGGFMAMLHPQERVIDEAQGGGPNVVVNNYSGSSVDVRDRNGEIEIIVREAENRLAAGITRGGSPLARTIEGAYKLRRGTK